MYSPVVAVILFSVCLSPIFLALFATHGYRAFKAGQKIRLTFIVIGLLIYVGFPLFHLGLIPGTSWYFDYRFTNRLTGKSFILGEPLHIYKTERHFNGDGYTAIIYELPEEIVAEFETPPPSFFDHPKRGEHRQGWHRQTWQRAPITGVTFDVAKFAGVLSSQDSMSRDSLMRPTTYHAYFFKELTPLPGARPTTILNVDLFVLDVEEGLLYVFNRNT